MATEKGPSRGPQKLPNCSGQEYAELAGLTREMFPSWNVEALRVIVQHIVEMAAPEMMFPGVFNSACAFIPGAGVLQVHFDGAGGVEIDPQSDCTPAMLDLGRALRLALGDKLTIGKPVVTA